MHKTSITDYELKVIKERFVHFKVPKCLQEIILEAVTELNKGTFVYNGTTLDEELGPNDIEESSLLHDYMWIVGWGGWLSNVIYAQSLKIYKASKVTRAYRFSFIFLGWYLLYIPKHIWRRNYKQIPQRFIDLRKELKTHNKNL